jgi:hypothetical protein
VKAEAAAGDQADRRVRCLDARVGQSVLDRGLDPGALLGDRLGQPDERWQATSPRPRDPPVEQRDRRSGREAVDLPELLLEQVGAVQPAVGRLDLGELRGLAAAEVPGGSSRARSARP